MALTIIFITLLLSPFPINSFNPRPTGSVSPIFTSTRLFGSPLSNEKIIREEINEKNSLVDAEDEIKYGSTVGQGIEFNKTLVIDAGKGSTYPSEVLQKIEKVTKERAYPLFLAEKVSIVVEQFVNSFQSKVESEYEPITKNNIESTDNNTLLKREKIVILGSGWGSAAFLKEIDTKKFDVTVISPNNFFLFTPMLAGASVGTVEYRSITENIREINSKASYFEGTATDFDPEKGTVSCESVICEGNSCTIEDFLVDYDKLILTMGAQTNTFGIKGVREYCCFLKQVEDAQRIRTALVNCFERANLPSLTDKQRQETLTFAVIGAGPTGVEFASELRDFVEQDGPKYYPELLQYVRIKIIEASPTVLAPFDKSLQEEAISQLTKSASTKKIEDLKLLPEPHKLTELLLGKGVSEMKEDVICLNDGSEIPYGLAVWAAGNGPLPITLQAIENLKKEQGQGIEQAKAQEIARGRVAVDPWLRAIGGKGIVFALGDCSCNTNNQLPATAQVASQQGEYLARLLSQNYDMNSIININGGNSILHPPKMDPNREKTLAEKISSYATQVDDIAAPFQFLNLGILAYTGGGSALAQFQVTPSEKGRVKGKGKIGFGLWRSVYLSKQISWRNRVLVFVDWTKTKVFGRDITRL